MLAACAALLAGAPPAYAHTIVGDRVFPATLTIDDPGVNDELALPSFAYMASANRRRLARIVQLFHGLGIRQDDHRRSRLFGRLEGFNWQTRPSAQGWSNIETQLKYVLWQDAKAEFDRRGRVQCRMGQHRQPAKRVAAVRSLHHG